MLGNIFIVNTPLHDGAVIIRENRVMAAGCLLPLTRDRSLSSELGTRHRAAIGLSEMADCVVVVVSEETGTISYTYGGHIYRHIDGETLRNRLKSFMMANKGKTSVVNDMFQKWRPRNEIYQAALVAAEILCLIAACAFWLYVMNEQNPIMTGSYTVPVEVRNLDRSLVALNVPQRVKVTVNMNRNALMQLHSDDIHAYVDMQNMTDGDYPNTKISVSLPGDGEVASVTPQYFDLKVDPYAVKSVPIRVNFFGELPSGYKSALKDTAPSVLTVAGSSSSIDMVNRAVVSVNLADKRESFTEFDSVSVMDEDGNTVTGIDVMPTQVRVAVEITEEQKTANIPLTAKVKGTPAAGYRVDGLTVAPLAATVTAPGSDLEAMKEINLGEIDVTGAEADVTQTLPIPVPAGSSAVPAEATVTVSVNGVQ